MARIRRAILSVSDKSGIVEFAKGLSRLGVELYASGGTAGLLREKKVPVRLIEEYTGFPEMLGGRVKTLNPKIHGGILAIRGNASHLKTIASHGIVPFDMVVVNLYPFEETIARPGCTLEEAIENIDIGGPAMLRSAAKNYGDVAVVTDPSDYPDLLGKLKKGSGNLDPGTHAELGRKAFALTARYDAAVSNYLERGEGGYPVTYTAQWRKVQSLRYGENPHQSAAFYADSRLPDEPTLGGARQLQGKELSYNNIVDLDAALQLSLEFSEPAAAIIKHTNPSGVGLSKRRLVDAFKKARECDPVSAYGGVIGFNRPVNAETAREVASTFFEAVIAPSYDKEAGKILSAKGNLRLLEAGRTFRWGGNPGHEMKKVSGGLLLQTRDRHVLDPGSLKIVTKRAPTKEELEALLFAWKVCKHVKSNAIVYALKDRTVGVGAGQMSRVDSAKIAVMKAQRPTAGTVVASDAFFPFRDGLDAAAAAGATAVIQPGGSVRDAEVIAAADEHGMAMVFTGVRHFRH
ncbi:MAG TPA: bifunctional phosphoribosylaminoimidazolecarboxamide formyltransferase/IMP cyclohydrolase [Candidatus Deferrimicrobiaceae bacterium]|nr:bifunctional phosphoribosylaminoimidazolecarboxamide formyltransferase/IMP cyclohydrolase [Candidatus Deferrimicrobiaceae bacterium]